MKIMHITWSLNTGGIETMLINIANEQIANNHEVYVVILNNVINSQIASSLDTSGHLICFNRKAGSKNPLPILRMNIYLLKLRPDVIHIHDRFIIKTLLPIFRHKLCLTVHDTIRDNCNCLYFDKFHKIFSISNSVKDSLYKKAHVNSDVVLNGIKVHSIKNINTKSNEHFEIVQVGRLLHTKKGQDILLNALHILVQKGYTNLRLTFIGDGPSRKYLEDLCNNLHLNGYVTFLGDKSQEFIFENLCKFNLFVQPSIYEGFGLTVAEAIAAKVPVLVSANEGPLEIIENGKYGYVFENKNIKDCAIQIENILKNYNQIKNEITPAAYKHISELYDVKNTAINYIEKYKTL